MATYTILNEPTLYPSAYMVLTNKGYTKHYYAGTERVAARLGGGGLDALYHVIGNDEELQVKADMLFDQSLEQVNNRILYENDLDCIMHNDFAKEEFGHWIDGIPYQMQAGVELNHDEFKDMVNSMLDDISHGQEKEVYFYHSDHLGSASWITDFSGVAVQHIQYLPYGEPYINQHPFGYSERFTFTGKEKDSETGFYYFGARYYDPALSGLFISIDPMADKYPSLSPYAYCVWNPMKLVDPDGMEIVIVGNNGKKYYWSNGKLYNGKHHRVEVNIYGKDVENKLNTINRINKTNSGSKVINSLSSSKESFYITGEKPSGGSCSYSRSTNKLRMGLYSDVGSFAHELFHAYQDLKGEPAEHSVYAEVEAYVFQGKVMKELGLDLKNNTGMTSHSYESEAKQYERAMNNLVEKFNANDFSYAVQKFRKYSNANRYGNYNKYNYVPNGVKITRSLLKKI